MKFHLHVVDGRAASASSSSSPASTVEGFESSAVLLFAHMTLRCGHLADVVSVSASTTPAAARQAQLLQQSLGAGAAGGSRLAATGGLVPSQRFVPDASGSEDTAVLQAAGAVLTGAVEPDSEEARALPYAALADGERSSIAPYAHFATQFAVAEQTLRAAVAASVASAVPPPPYFDLVATTDMTTFEYVVDYYQQLRVRYGGSAMGGGGRGTKPVGVLHIVAEDPSRAARVLQRVLEMVLKRSGWAFSVDANADEDADAEEQHAREEGDGEEVYEHSADDEEESAAGAAAAGAGAGTGGVVGHGDKLDSWANHIDEAVHLFAQLFGVDVLVALV